jgi:hypothetical protein
MATRYRTDASSKPAYLLWQVVFLGRRMTNGDEIANGELANMGGGHDGMTGLIGRLNWANLNLNNPHLNL